MTLRRTLKRSLSTTTRKLLQFGNSAPSLLLDTYPGAAAAYSLRKLSSSYSGSAIRVRRASDSAEQDIGFSGNDLDTASLTSFCTGTDGFVTTWYDQSGGGNDATQATTTKQPKVYDNAGGINVDSNGNPAVLSSETTDTFLGLASDLTFAPSNEFGMFFLVEPSATITAATGAQIIMRSNAFSSLGDFQCAFGSSTSRFVSERICFLSQPDITGYADETADISGMALFSATMDTSFNFLYARNGTLTTATTGSSGGFSGTSTPKKVKTFCGVDVGNSFDGNVSELILYSADQASNRTGIESNIATYYGITLP